MKEHIINEEQHNEHHKGNHEEEPESKLKKIAVLIIGIFLLLTSLSYFLLGPQAYDVIAGQLESTPLDNNIIQLENFSIIFNEPTLQELQTIYLAEQKVEFSLCLKGNKQSGNYYITSLYQPKTFQATFNHVSFEPCSSDTLIMLHSHPYKSCLASETDINTLRNTQQYNPSVLMVVMCEPGRFSVYS